MKNLNQILRCLDIPEMIHFDTNSVVANAIQKCHFSQQIS